MVNLFDQFWRRSDLSDRRRVQALNLRPSLFRLSVRHDEQREHAGPLSLKSVASGRALYRFRKQASWVRSGEVLLVPTGERYGTLVPDQAKIVSLYFPDKHIAQAALSLYGSAEANLDLEGGRPVNLEFPTHRLTATPALHLLLGTLERAGERNEIVELVNETLAVTVRLIVESNGFMSRAPAVRAGVRRELFRRVSVARAYIEDALPREVSLGELAEQACLSSFHLHRAFKAIYRETPGAMLNRRRMELARALLLGADPIHEVALRCGFSSDSAFSRRFRDRHGLSPREFREAQRGRGQSDRRNFSMSASNRSG